MSSSRSSNSRSKSSTPKSSVLNSSTSNSSSSKSSTPKTSSSKSSVPNCSSSNCNASKNSASKSNTPNSASLKSNASKSSSTTPKKSSSSKCNNRKSLPSDVETTKISNTISKSHKDNVDELSYNLALASLTNHSVSQKKANKGEYLGYASHIKDDHIQYKTSYTKKLNEVLGDFTESDSENNKFYNYVLLDSRKIVNATDNVDAFANSVIYVGKGKGNRAFDHMRDARKALADGGAKSSKKINKIIEIWKDGGSVQVLKVAENIGEHEALTREAFQIDAIGKKQLTNVKSGTYYGTASIMLAKEKHDVGIALLEEGRKALATKGAEPVYAYKSSEACASMNNLSPLNLDPFSDFHFMSDLKLANISIPSKSSSLITSESSCGLHAQNSSLASSKISDESFKLPQRAQAASSDSYYVYLLLDSRKMKNAEYSNEAFANAVFYVDKGKNDQAFEHLREAKKIRKLGYAKTSSKIINKILDIWDADEAVYIIKAHENIRTDMEAEISKALYIKVIGKHQLINLNEIGNDEKYDLLKMTMETYNIRKKYSTLLKQGREVLINKRAERVDIFFLLT